MKNLDLKIGDEISNNQLHEIFGCSTLQGMRKSNKLGVLVLVSKPIDDSNENFWENGVLHYTGTGLEGNQTLFGTQNKTLFESNENGIELHLFEVFQESVYTYQGIAKLVGEPYQRLQMDKSGNLRMVWMFPIKPIAMKKDIVRENEGEDRALIRRLENVDPDQIDLTEEYVPEPKEKDKVITRGRVELYRRNADTAYRALAYAKFACEVDSDHKSFVRRNMNVNYTEPHHLVPLEYADRFSVSLDVEANIVSLCSNCHNQLHYGEEFEEILHPLYEKRQEMLKQAGIEIEYEELREMYI